MSDHIAHDDLSAFLDDELSPERRSEVVAHLTACETCAARLEEVRWTIRFVSSLPIADVPEGTRLTARIPATTDRGWSRPARVAAFAAAAAAVLVASVALLGLGLSRLAGTDPGAVDPSASDPLRAARSEEASEHASLDEAAAFARPPTPDSLGAGYPRPFATARTDDLAERGGVPPPELGGIPEAPTRIGDEPTAWPAYDGPTEVALASGPDAEEGGPAAALESAPGARPATPLPAIEAADGLAADGTRAADVPLPGPGVGVLIALAGVLLILSAALFVRAWSR